MPRRDSHLHGLLIVDKPGLQQFTAQQPHTPTADSSNDAINGELPRLYTSHDIVQLTRRWSGQRRIGHTGTLDPMASGLLVLCLGQATRLVEYYQGHDKCYYAEISLGQTTDTYDAMGQVVETMIVPPLTAIQIAEALAQFQGDILQVPPIYSALKQGGESLHRKARRGEEVTVQPRPVTIHSLELVDFHAPDRLCLRVHCSAGTYIRSLAYDLGRALGCCAHLSLLRRETVGHFTLAQSATLADIERAAETGTFDRLLLPIGMNLEMPELIVSAAVAMRLGQGQKVYLSDQETINLFKEQLFRAQNVDTRLVKIVDDNAHFWGIGRYLKQNSLSAEEHPGETLWKAEKWLAGTDEI